MERRRLSTPLLIVALAPLGGLGAMLSFSSLFAGAGLAGGMALFGGLLHARLRAKTARSSPPSLSEIATQKFEASRPALP